MAVNPDPVQIASKAFESADNYDEVRKCHSLESVKLFLSKLNIKNQEKECNGSKSEGTTILELGAGTGKLTKVLVEAIMGTNIHLTVSEPVESMGKVLKNNFPDLEYICCRSEKIPLPDCSVHAVVAGNALHFISSPESFAEIGRVLAPGGVIAFLLNYVNLEEAQWLQPIFDMSCLYYQKVGIDFAFTEKGLETDWQEKMKASGSFEEIHKEFVVHLDSITEENALRYFMSAGAFQLCNEDEKETIRSKCKKILKDRFGGVDKSKNELPMKCFLYWSRKRIPK